MQLRKDFQFRNPRLDDLPGALIHFSRALNREAHNRQFIGIFLSPKLKQLRFDGDFLAFKRHGHRGSRTRGINSYTPGTSIGQQLQHFLCGQCRLLLPICAHPGRVISDAFIRRRRPIRLARANQRRFPIRKKHERRLMLPERPVAGEVINVRSPAQDDRADIFGIHRPQQPLLSSATKRCFQHVRHFIATRVLRTGIRIYRDLLRR